jgi:uncharacterized protein involved in cysteine biosynthesis
VPWIEGLLARWDLMPQVGFGVGSVLYAVAIWFFGGVLYLALSGVLSSLLWDRLSMEVERGIRGTAALQSVGCVGTLWDTVLRGTFSCAIAVASFAFGCCTFGIAGVLLAGWLGLLDYTASPFIRRGVLFTGQFGRVFSLKGWRSFAIGAGVITLAPLVNVLLLPAMVVGGTLLYLDSESELSR